MIEASLLMSWSVRLSEHNRKQHYKSMQLVPDRFIDGGQGFHSTSMISVLCLLKLLFALQAIPCQLQSVRHWKRISAHII